MNSISKKIHGRVFKSCRVYDRFVALNHDHILKGCNAICISCVVFVMILQLVTSDSSVSDTQSQCTESPSQKVTNPVVQTRLEYNIL